MKLLLDKQTSKKSVNKNKFIPVSLGRNGEIIPTVDVYDNLNVYERYIKERNECERIRLVLSVNSVCTNVLFNPITEVVKNEGSDKVECLNFKDGKKFSTAIGKGEDYVWKYIDIIRDTQLSRDAQIVEEDEEDDACGYDYHCGIDIFSNHILRNITSKAVRYTSKTKYEKDKESQEDMFNPRFFNTIMDSLRDSEGLTVKGNLISKLDEEGDSYTVLSPSPLYDKENDILTFNESIEKNLIDNNGWFGFNNKSSMPSNYVDFRESEFLEKPLDIYSVINGKNNKDKFIDMYPDRTLFSFVPKYNSIRHRVENNWDYSITYPSSSTTVGFDDFLNSDIDSLKILYFNPFYKNENGDELTMFFCICQHGLNEGDIINIYSSYINEDNEKIDEILINGCEIFSVIDRYTFCIRKNGNTISDRWVSTYGVDTIDCNNGKEDITIIKKDYYYWYDSNNNTYCANVSENNINVDYKTQNLSFKKIDDNGVECKYYVRIFSKIPNKKYVGKDDSMIYNFDNHNSKLSFSTNAYGDSISEIVFTDDIDVSGLKDNLGRPLTDLYLTVTKRNKGYKEWYGINNREIEIQSNNVEYSHCFGANMCSFRLSDQAYHCGVADIRTINTFESKNGYNIGRINKEGYKDADSNYEIEFDNTVNFYGDICCYNDDMKFEQVLQTIQNRFNTAQRELKKNDKANEYLSTIEYDDFVIEEGDNGNSKTFSTITANTNARIEGYYHQMHHRIPFRTLSSDLYNSEPITYTLKYITQTYWNDNEGNPLFEVCVKEECYLVKGSVFDIYSFSDSETYVCEVYDILSDTRLLVTISNKNHKVIDYTNIPNLKLCVRDSETTPYYAELSKDGSCKYVWREVLDHGDSNGIGGYEHPFANGAIYVTHNINFFLRRQNPYGYYGARVVKRGGESIPEYEPNGQTYDIYFDDDIDNYTNIDKNRC